MSLPAACAYLFTVLAGSDYLVPQCPWQGAEVGKSPHLDTRCVEGRALVACPCLQLAPTCLPYWRSTRWDITRPLGQPWALACACLRHVRARRQCTDAASSAA